MTTAAKAAFTSIEELKGRFDLHIHTTASDGVYRPEQIVHKAKQAGIQTIAITDHDTLEGLDEALEAAARSGIQVIPGIELSTKYNGISVDLLGYNIQESAELNERLRQFRDVRENRALRIIERFTALGMPLTIEDVKAYRKGSVIARPHIAAAVVDKGYAASIQEVFDEYLADGKPCAVPKMVLTPEQGIELIHRAGGIAVLAHPALLGDDALAEELLDRYAFDGVEVWHRRHSAEDSRRYAQLAERYQLLVTGGSDFHSDEHRLGEFGYVQQALKGV